MRSIKSSSNRAILAAIITYFAAQVVTNWLRLDRYNLFSSRFDLYKLLIDLVVWVALYAAAFGLLTTLSGSGRSRR
jgi:hypothetical protein